MKALRYIYGGILMLIGNSYALQAQNLFFEQLEYEVEWLDEEEQPLQEIEATLNHLTQTFVKEILRCDEWAEAFHLLMFFIEKKQSTLRDPLITSFYERLIKKMDLFLRVLHAGRTTSFQYCAHGIDKCIDPAYLAYVHNALLVLNMCTNYCKNQGKNNRTKVFEEVVISWIHDEIYGDQKKSFIISLQALQKIGELRENLELETTPFGKALKYGYDNALDSLIEYVQSREQEKEVPRKKMTTPYSNYFLFGSFSLVSGFMGVIILYWAEIIALSQQLPITVRNK